MFVCTGKEPEEKEEGNKGVPGGTEGTEGPTAILPFFSTRQTWQQSQNQCKHTRYHQIDRDEGLGGAFLQAIHTCERQIILNKIYTIISGLNE